MEPHQFPFFQILLSFLLCAFMASRNWRKSKSSNLTSPNLPPGPRKLPFIGNVHQLVSCLPHHALTELAKKYGPVMLVHFGEVPTVVISSAEAAKEVLKTNGVNFGSRTCSYTACTTFYNRKDIFFAPYGDYWRQLRKVCTMELLSARRVRSFKPIREEEVSNFIKSISFKEGLPINISKMISSLNTDLIARTSIGKKSKKQEAFLSIIKEINSIISVPNILDLFPSVKLFQTLSWTKFKLERVHHVADTILEDIMNEHRARNTKTAGENAMADLLDVLLNLQDSGDYDIPITNETIKGIIMDIFSAGGDTTSITLEWVMAEMLRNPRVMTQAQNEVREVFSDKGNVDESGLQELIYLKLIVKETLRLHPALPLIPREYKESCKIHGYDINEKSGATIINIWAIGRDPDYWSEPEKFYPERFLASSADYMGTDFEFIPFGAGKRICPGMWMSMTNVEFIVANLLYHFDWKLPNGMKGEDLDMTENFGGTVGRKYDLILVPIPYDLSPIE